MTDTAIRIYCLKPFQITLHVAAQIAFNLDLVVRDGVDDFVQLLRRKIFRANVGINIGLLENAPGCAETDPVDIC